MSDIDEFISTLIVPRAFRHHNTAGDDSSAVATYDVSTPQTVYDVYNIALNNLCYHIVSAMTAYQKEVLGGGSTRKSDTTFPLSVVHALYKFIEYFTPVSRKDRVYELVDESLLCNTCKVCPIYRPCNRSKKRRVADKYARQCLQCYITTGISTRSGTIYEYVACKLAYETNLVDCKCHAHTLLLMFPAYILFSSEFTLKFLVREQIMDILSTYYHTKDPAATVIRLHSTVNMYQKLRRRHIDAHYLKSMIAESLSDHFMLCTGACVNMRMTLRQSGASSRTSQFLSMLTSMIGISHDTAYPPQPHYDDTAVTRRDEGDLYVRRLQFNIHRVRESRKRQHSSSQQQQRQEMTYCPSCSCHIDTLLINLPSICKLDNLYEIGKRSGPYTVTHIDRYAPPPTSTAAATAAVTTSSSSNATTAAVEPVVITCRCRPHKRQRMNTNN